MSLCNQCQMNKIVSGCAVPIRELEVKKGIGVVSCAYFMELNGNLTKAYEINNKIVNKRRFKYIKERNYMPIIKCHVCNYESEQRKWISISASSPDGYANLDAKIYDSEKGWIHYKIFACPNCGTMKVQE